MLSHGGILKTYPGSRKQEITIITTSTQHGTTGPTLGKKQEKQKE